MLKGIGHRRSILSAGLDRGPLTVSSPSTPSHDEFEIVIRFRSSDQRSWEGNVLPRRFR